MKIATRIRLLGPLLVLGTAALVGLVELWGSRTLLEDLRARTLTAQAEAEAERLAYALRGIQLDALLLSELPAVRAFAAAASGRETTDSAEVWADRMAGIFHSMLSAKTDYAQIRLIGVANDGREIVRVERTGTHTRRVPDTELQTKAGRDYFLGTLGLRPGRIYVSDITLNQEFGEFVEPHQPMMRAAVPIYVDDDMPFGLVVINMYFDRFIDRVLRTRGGNEYDYYLTNPRGDYVLHRDPAREFGFDLGMPYGLQSEFPALSTILSPDAEVVTVELTEEQRPGGGLIQARRIYPFLDTPERFLVLALATSFDSINATVATINKRVIGLTIALLLGAGWLAYMLSRQIIAPLGRLTATALSVTEHGRADFAPSARDDEIGTLSRALEHMVARLDDRNRQLETANVDLEYFARIASHDLREPARRMALLANLLQLEARDGISDEGRATLQRIRDEGLRMINQLTDLRAFSRLGQNALVREPTAIASLITSLLDQYREQLSERSVATSVDAMPTTPVYPRLVELLYTNMIENALQHGPETGFELRFTFDEATGTFGVYNSGSTITGDPKQIFEAFESSGDRREHSGLGLSICRRIVERHHGRLWVEHGDDYVHFRFTLTDTDVEE